MSTEASLSKMRMPQLTAKIGCFSVPLLLGTSSCACSCHWLAVSLEKRCLSITALTFESSMAAPFFNRLPSTLCLLRYDFFFFFFFTQVQTPVTLCSGELWSILVVRLAHSADLRSRLRHVSSAPSWCLQEQTRPSWSRSFTCTQVSQHSLCIYRSKDPG